MLTPKAIGAVIAIGAIITIAVFARSLAVRYHLWRAHAASEMMRRHGTPTMMPVEYSERFKRHQQALISLGYLVERRFDLSHSLPTRDSSLKLAAEAMARFPAGAWSFGPASAGSFVKVTARADEMESWEGLLVENGWTR